MLWLNPNNADAYSGLGFSYHSMGDADVFTNRELIEKLDG